MAAQPSRFISKVLDGRLAFPPQSEKTAWPQKQRLTRNPEAFGLAQLAELLIEISAGNAAAKTTA